jgi:type I restriction enzyme M protein
MDLVEAVIGLAPNLFYGTGLAACILVCAQASRPSAPGKVLIADASRLFRRGRAQNYLEPEHAAEILGWYRGFADVQDAPGGQPRRDQGRGLDAEHLALRAAAARRRHPAAARAIAAFKEALTRCREAEERLRQVMTEGGWLR